MRCVTDTQHLGLFIATEIGDDNHVASHVTWPGVSEIFDIVEMVCGVVFNIELVLKLAALNIEFPRDP